MATGSGLLAPVAVQQSSQPAIPPTGSCNNMSAASQQFCLKWNNHTSNLVRTFTDMISDENFVDVTLACDGIYIKAHKMVLSACSNYFKELFLVNPCKHPIVILKDMKFEDLRAIIDFMYKGEVNVSQNQLGALLKTAEVLRVKGLTEVNDGEASDVKPPIASSSSSSSSSSNAANSSAQQFVNGLDHSEIVTNGTPMISNVYGSNAERLTVPEGSGLSLSSAAAHSQIPHAQPQPTTGNRKRRKRPRVVKREPVCNTASNVTLSSAPSLPLLQPTIGAEEELANSDSMPSDEETVDIEQAVAAVANAKRVQECATQPSPSTTVVLPSSSQLPQLPATAPAAFLSVGAVGDQSAIVNRPKKLVHSSSQPTIRQEASSTDGGNGDGISNDSADNWASIHGQGLETGNESMENGDDDEESGEDEMIDMKPIISFDEGGQSSQHSVDNLMNSTLPMTPDGPYGTATQESSQGSTGKICVCHLCHLTFTAYSSLRRHMARHYADRERYECDICFKSYSRKDYLKEHKKLKHSIN
ncbi:Protein bric-a-brac 2 [Halotydeus destructor]|nr:Protein bric-a-brac 2 [Halotydeus destructor]